jgi:hypothetical protein
VKKGELRPIDNPDLVSHSITISMVGNYLSVFYIQHERIREAIRLLLGTFFACLSIT